MGNVLSPLKSIGGSEADLRGNPIERWEIYAWAIRDILSKASGLPKLDVQYRDVLRYEDELGWARTAQ
jgi:hypothetical protein